MGLYLRLPICLLVVYRDSFILYGLFNVFGNFVAFAFEERLLASSYMCVRMYRGDYHLMDFSEAL